MSTGLKWDTKKCAHLDTIFFKYRCTYIMEDNDESLFLEMVGTGSFSSFLQFKLKLAHFQKTTGLNRESNTCTHQGTIFFNILACNGGQPWKSFLGNGWDRTISQFLSIKRKIGPLRKDYLFEMKLHYSAHPETFYYVLLYLHTMRTMNAVSWKWLGPSPFPVSLNSKKNWPTSKRLLVWSENPLPDTKQG